MKKIILVLLIAISLHSFAQTIHEYNYDVNNGNLSTWFDEPGNIIYPTNYTAYNYKTPVVFVHGIIGKVSTSYETNIDQVINYNLNAAFVQLNPLGSPEENGKLLKRMIDRITTHFGSATVSIVAHSKGGMDTERALYGRNPYNNSIPSFGYEKVDGVYTLSSPLRGSRLADVGAALSWTGVAFIAMWYANGYQLTSGSVNSFHNWAKSWRINSYTTFKNYYNPNGASYSRINMTEDNTTRWWAHQSDDPCYQHIWYYCYVGNAFQHSAGAYYDAYWQWAGFHSGWRNWHSSNDGFIAEYRAKRSVITDASNPLTPDAGDSNWRVMHDANHTSLWRKADHHFSNEVAPYLHRGLYVNQGYYRPSSNNNDNLNKIRVNASNLEKVILLSKGNAYFSKTGNTQFIIEENNQSVNLVLFTESPINQFEIIDNSKKNMNIFSVIKSKKDNFTNSYQSVAHIENLKKGVYQIHLPVNNFVLMAEYETSNTAFGVNFNYNETKGYNGEKIEVAIANKNNAIDFSKVNVKAQVNLISIDGENPIKAQKQKLYSYNFKSIPNKTGHYKVRLKGLTPGAVYGIRIEAISTEGDNLLSRNVINTFYVQNDLALKQVNVTDNDKIQINDNMISIYPNPAKDVVNISIEKYKDFDIKLFSQSGQLISSIKQEGITTKLNIKNLRSGIYFVKLINGNTTIVKQLIIK